MRIPKYINELLEKRAKYAELFTDVDDKISYWIEENGIDAPIEDYGMGARSLGEPRESIETIRECILNK